MGGRRYKRRSGARTIAASTTKQDCPECRGFGVVPCGCVRLEPADLEALGRPWVAV